MSSAATQQIQQKTHARWQADLALAVVAIIWGSTFVVVKTALHEISTVFFLAVRFTLASACMALLFSGALGKMPGRQIRRGLAGGAVAGLFLWLGYMLQTFGLKYTTAGNSGFLTGLYIVLVPVIGALVFRRRPQWAEVIGIAVAAVGMVVMTLPSLDKNLRLNFGDLLTMGCALAFALHLLVVGYYSQRERFEAVALGQIACAAVLSIISLLVEPPKTAWSHSVVFAIILTAVFATALAFALQTWGQQYTTATRTALIFALEPVVALAAAVWFGGEALTVYATVGGALILAGILAVELKPAALRA